MPGPDMTPSPLAPDENNNNFFGLCYRADFDAIYDCSTVTRMMRGIIGYVVQEPEITDEFRQFFIIMHCSKMEKRVLVCKSSSLNSCMH